MNTSETPAERFGRRTVAALSLLLVGRAMTLAYLGRVGGTGPGDPPAAWLMPLVGDAVIGVAGLLVVYLALRGRSAGAWLVIVLWNALGIWDALAAYLVHLSVPWPEFFMVQMFGSAMFFAATAMHAICLALIYRPPVRNSFASHPV